MNSKKYQKKEEKISNDCRTTKLTKAKELIDEIWKWQPKKTDFKIFKKYYDDTLAKKRILFNSAEKFGTPLYVLDEEKLNERIQLICGTFRKYLPESEFYYAFKSNDLPHLISIIKHRGVYADVAGLFELQLALRLGFEKIIFTGPGKDEEELMLAIENSDKVIINIDSTAELRMLARLAKKTKTIKNSGNNEKKAGKVRISFRVNPDSALMQSWSKFGIEMGELKNAISDALKCPELEWTGLQFHCSWNTTPEKYLKNIDILGEFLFSNFNLQELENLSFIDIGGGFFPEGTACFASFFPKGTLMESLNEHDDKNKDDFGFNPLQIVNEEVKSIEFFAKSISKKLEACIFSKLGRRIRIFMEPGRFVSLHPTLILVKVMSVKNEKSVITSGGVSLVGDYRYEYEFAPIVNLTRPDFTLKEKIIYGPTCDPNDYWGKMYFGKDIKEGDILAILNQGAYTFTCAWRFIKPIAPYVAISAKKNKIDLVKKRESFEDRYSGCKL